MRSASIVARLNGDGTARLALSSSPDLADAYLTPSVDVVGGVARFTIDGLTPGVTHYYAVEVNGLLDRATTGAFRVPTQSHTFAFGSCAATLSEHAVFGAIAAAAPDFFIHLGDLHYRDIVENDPQRYRDAYDAILASTVQGGLWRALPIAYVWDDHDFGPNDSDTTSPSKPAAYQAYREYVPHQPLASPTGEGIYQSFVVGRVRYVLTDLRSKRSSKRDADGLSKVVLGAAQEAWFRAELLAAKAAGQAVCWANSKPWVGQQEARADHWAGYTTERTRLANFVRDNGLAPRTFIVSGDMHAVAFYDADTEAHGDYATEGGGANMHVLHAAPLDKNTHHKGGPYTGGPLPDPPGAWKAQYGLCTIDDAGGATIGVAFSARDHENQELLSHAFTLDVA